MTLRRLFQGIIAVAGMTVIMTLTTFAGVKDAGFLISNKHGYIFNAISGSDISENYAQAEKILNTACPAVGMTTLNKTYGTNTGSILIPADGVDKIDSIQNQVNVWLAANIQTIIPQGTPAEDILNIAADWVADQMNYDYAAIGNPELGYSYQSALNCFTEGKGVCATYAYAFNSIVSAVPVANDIVDYSASNPSYLATRFVYNTDHAWSAINENGTWHFYDVCNYDANRDKSYLGMNQDKLNNGDYRNIRITF